MEFLHKAYDLVTSIPMHTVQIATAVIGISVIVFLVSQARITGISNLKRHRSEAPGVADLLNWAAVIDNGVILNKNGSLMAAWVFRGGDNASVTNADRNAVSRYINAALNQLGSGWMIHVDAVRRPCPSYSPRASSHFPDSVTAAIDEERRRFFSQLSSLYEGCFVLTATYFPPLLAQAKFVELMFDDPSAGDGNDLSVRGSKIVEDFKREIVSLEGRLSSVFELERLRSYTVEDVHGKKTTYDDLLRWLHFCLTGNNHPVVLPRNPAYIDTLVGGQDLTSGMTPLVGNKYVMVVGIDNFPFESFPGVLSNLAELPCEYRWSTRFIFMDPHESISLINKYKRKWKQKIRGFMDQVLRTDSGSIDHDARSMFDDCELALMEVNSGVVSMGLYTSVVVLMDEDIEVLKKCANHIQKTLGVLGFPSRIEDVNTQDAFLGSLPGHGVENVRRSMMNTRHLADLMPTSSIWTGRDQAPCNLYPEKSPPLMHCVTTGSTPFRLNLHVGDLGHTLILGRTGGGKSVLIGILVAQFLRYLGMTVYVFDKGRSIYTLCKAVGGNHYNVAGQDDEGGGRQKFAFCPLQWLQSKADLSWACFWIESLASLNGVNVTPEQRNEIARRMDVFFRSGERTLLSFVTGIMDKELATALEIYTREGMFGYLLDADEDSLDLKEDGGLTVFEIEDLMSFGDPKIILPVLLYLFRRIERSLHGQPAAIFLDEAWLMLGHPVFRDKLREWFKIMRKNNCSVIIATQSLSDVMNSDIVDVIKDSTATKIYLPNPHAKTEDATELYRRMGLNSRQIDIIANAIQKRQYYFTSEEGNRLFELALGPLQLALIAVSDKESLARVRDLEARFGDGWLAEWLMLRGVDPTVISNINKGLI